MVNLKLNSNEIDVSNLPEGAYIINLVFNDRLIKKKIIKQ